MRKTRLSMRRGGVVGVTSPAQCSLTVLWQVAFHHQHQSITPTPPPASATTREKFAWNYLSRCDGGWATQGEAVSTFRSRGGSCLHLAIIFIFWTYVLVCCHWIKDCTLIVVLCISNSKHLILQMWTVDTGQTQKLQKKRNIDSQQFILSTEWSVSLGGERV